MIALRSHAAEPNKRAAIEPRPPSDPRTRARRVLRPSAVDYLTLAQSSGKRWAPATPAATAALGSRATEPATRTAIRSHRASTALGARLLRALGTIQTPSETPVSEL